MDEKKYVAEEIKLKVIKLLKLIDELKHKCSQLEKENILMKIEIDSQKKSISALEDRNKIIKLADSLSNSKSDIQGLKKKVNEYISEIDECIRLLSDR